MFLDVFGLASWFIPPCFLPRFPPGPGCEGAIINGGFVRQDRSYPPGSALCLGNTAIGGGVFWVSKHLETIGKIVI
jgi:hypothetical protein